MVAAAATLAATVVNVAGLATAGLAAAADAPAFTTAVVAAAVAAALAASPAAARALWPFARCFTRWATRAPVLASSPLVLADCCSLMRFCHCA